MSFRLILLFSNIYLVTQVEKGMILESVCPVRWLFFFFFLHYSACFWLGCPFDCVNPLLRKHLLTSRNNHPTSKFPADIYSVWTVFIIVFIYLSFVFSVQFLLHLPSIVNSSKWINLFTSHTTSTSHCLLLQLSFFFSIVCRLHTLLYRTPPINLHFCYGAKENGKHVQCKSKVSNNNIQHPKR